MTQILIRDCANAARDGWHSITDYIGRDNLSMNGNVKRVYLTGVPISIPTPAYRQPDNWSCCCFSTGNTLNKDGEIVRTWMLQHGLVNSTSGAAHSAPVQYLNACGYSCTMSAYINNQMHPAEFDEVVAHLKKGFKVILLMGGRDSYTPCRTNGWTFKGHFVMAYGVKEDGEQPTSGGYEVNFKDLKYGDSGQDVKTLQTMLNGLGYYRNGIDGKFGDGTLAGVKAYQKNHGMAGDGIVGKNTWNKLFGK